MTGASRRKRAQAVLFSAIMVLSMVAVGVGGLAGGVAADSTTYVVGSGENADYDTIQGAIDGDASQDDIILVEDGEYDPFESNIENVTITAADGASPNITASESQLDDATDPIVYLGGNDVTFSDIDVEGPSRGTGVGVRIGTSAAIDASNAEVSGVDVSNVLTGIQAGSNAEDSLIDSNDISNAVVGISIIGDAATVSGNTISDVDSTGDVPSEGIGIAGTDHTIEANEISAASGVVEVRVYNDELPTVNGESQNETAVANAILEAEGVDSVEFDSSENLYDGSITVGDASYATLQQAQDAASEGDTVEVNPGTYEESVTIDTPGLTLEGPYADTPGHDSTRGENEAIIEGQIRFDDAADVTVTGFTVDEPEGGFAGTKHGIELNSAPGVEIRNNIVRKNEESGFGIGTNNGLAGDATIAGNYVENGTVAGVAVLSENSLIEGDSINIDIINNKAENPATEGIYVFEQTGSEFSVPVDLTIEGNSVQDAGAYDIKLGSSRSESLSGFSSINGIGTGSENAPEDTGDSILESNAGVNSVEYALNDVSEVFTVETLTVSSGESIQEAVDTATELDIGTIEIESGTYNQNVTINAPNVTIDGHGSAVIDGRIDIPVDEVTVTNLTVQNGARAGSEAEGIFIGNADGFDNLDGDVTLRNVVVEDVHGHGTGSTVEGVHVKYYDDGDEIDGITFDNLTVRNVTQTAEGADGVKLQAKVDDVSITNSTFSDIEGAWAYGVVSTPSSLEEDVPEDVTLRRNTIENVTATEYDGVGLGIDGGNGNGYADASDVRATQNDFLNNDVDILNKEPDGGPMFAPLNYFGEDGPTVTGNVVYDPVLTTSEENVAADSARNITEYGSVLDLQSDGSRALAVGFSARPDEPVGEIFGEMDITGNAFVYDNEAGEYQDASGDYVPSVGEVVVLTSEGAIDETVTVPVETDIDNEAATPESVSLSNGWNLVATGGTVGFDSSTLDIAGAEVQNDLQLQAQPSQPGLAEGEELPPSEAYTGAFEGTWLFVDDEPDSDAQLATGYAEDQSAEEYIFEVVYPNDPQAEYPPVPIDPRYPPEFAYPPELIYENPDAILAEENTDE